MVYAGTGLTIPAASTAPDLNNSGTATAFVVAQTVAQLRIQLGRDLLVVY